MTSIIWYIYNRYLKKEEESEEKEREKERKRMDRVRKLREGHPPEDNDPPE